MDAGWMDGWTEWMLQSGIWTLSLFPVFADSELAIDDINYVT